ncbi:hypothetical protein GCM10010329_10220 [Streptomyces spiroverticillatus]|uniref:DUF1963 domain-containing protein n=1 Tax=Streptomyces finlayi TaxID=67296 RepID=A0A918WXZ0_9ACTN|nr:DUF1963 domain-containing protein [Streptomyces finlayi]GGZ91715.1 hypothetical protein GCM10010329_10220 [Streptomyces spiroverticillatus]GHC93597.1 hypothetical protein GCM10010334_30870 [Streptomyces finlayi]
MVDRGRERAEDIAGLRQKIAAYGRIAPYADEIVAMAEYGIALKQTEDAVFSRVGGEPELPEEAGWPDGWGLRFVAQFDLAELAGADVAGALPEKGLLYLFVQDPEYSVAGHTPCQVLYFPDAETARTREVPSPPEELEDEDDREFAEDGPYLEEPYRVVAVRALTLPALLGTALAERGVLEEEEEGEGPLDLTPSAQEEIDAEAYDLTTGPVDWYDMLGHLDEHEEDVRLNCAVDFLGVPGTDGREGRDESLVEGEQDPRTVFGQWCAVPGNLQALRRERDEWVPLFELGDQPGLGSPLYFLARRADLAAGDFSRVWAHSTQW